MDRERIHTLIGYMLLFMSFDLNDYTESCRQMDNSELSVNSLGFKLLKHYLSSIHLVHTQYPSVFQAATECDDDDPPSSRFTFFICRRRRLHTSAAWRVADRWY